MRLSLKKGAHAVLSRVGVQEIRGISLVFREMWDTADLTFLAYWAQNRSELKVCGIPHLAKNERDVGHPSFVVSSEKKAASNNR